jgi:hypothetical protein
MRVSKPICVVGILLSAASGAHAENLLKGLQKKLGADPLATICANAPCRKNVKIALKKDDGDFTLTMKLAPPIVYNGSVTVFPGDTIRLEAGEGANAFKNLKPVAAAEHPERTITITFRQELRADAKPAMALTIINPFGAKLSYAALTVRSGDPATVAGADVCPAAAAAASRQEWPGLVTDVVLNDFRLLEPDEEPSCPTQ